MLSPLFINKLALPNLATITQYPALTVGLSVFTFLLLVIDLCSNQALSQKFSLYPNAPFEFDLNRLSFYLLFHRGFTHWLLNVVGLFSHWLYLKELTVRFSQALPLTCQLLPQVYNSVLSESSYILTPKLLGYLEWSSCL